MEFTLRLSAYGNDFATRVCGQSVHVTYQEIHSMFTIDPKEIAMRKFFLAPVVGAVVLLSLTGCANGDAEIAEHVRSYNTNLGWLDDAEIAEITRTGCKKVGSTESFGPWMEQMAQQFPALGPEGAKNVALMGMEVACADKRQEMMG